MGGLCLRRVRLTKSKNVYEKENDPFLAVGGLFSFVAKEDLNYSDCMIEERLNKIRSILLVLGYISLAIELFFLVIAGLVFRQRLLSFHFYLISYFTFQPILVFITLPPISLIVTIILLMGLTKSKKWAYYLMPISVITQIYALIITYNIFNFP